MNITYIQEGETDTLSLKRSLDTGTEEQRQAVQRIIQEVRKNGNEAVRSFTKQFDGVSIEEPLVTEDEMARSYERLEPEMIQIIQTAIRHIRTYHERQLTSSWFYHQQDGSMLGQKVTPLDAVGVYVPGGTAAYPSSVLMNVIPALVAGVERIVLVTPPGKTAVCLMLY